MPPETPISSRPWYHKGLKFKCEGTTCGDCCSGKWGPGYVWVSTSEMQKLADYVGMTLDQFTRTFVRQVGTRFSLIEKRNNDCIFYEAEKGCSVYHARPAQCAAYPFWPETVKNRDAWNEEAKKCPGINCGEQCDIHTSETIDAHRKASKRQG